MDDARTVRDAPATFYAAFQTLPARRIVAHLSRWTLMIRDVPDRGPEI